MQCVNITDDKKVVNEMIGLRMQRHEHELDKCIYIISVPNITWPLICFVSLFDYI